MELKQFLKVIWRRWWLAAVAAAVTLGLTFIYTSRQPWVYEAEATFVVRPRLVDAADSLKATDTLIRGAEINSTFAGIARSEIVGDRAAEVVGSDRVKGQGMSVRTDVVAGTNILRITVSGGEPELVQEYAAAVAGETVRYIDDLNDVYALAALDPPEIPNSPAGPNKGMTNIIGGVLGVMLGAVLAFAVEYLSEPVPEIAAFDILDSESGAYNEAYFKNRFDQELSRGTHTGQVFTLAMIQASPSPAGAQEDVDPSEVAALLTSVVRPEDLLAHVGDGTFALIMAGTPESEAERKLADWAVQTWPASDGVPPPDSPFAISVGVCQYGGDELPPSVRAI
ncbi:MAG: Wzz/FepE/Etk N-terminal domain-containing protein [Acidimicrobiia bacterium]|nr:Wzz/FepE/Etk N-terminal domain-containing protein [Acidimicrobiia bacterium]MDH4308774.1 Wzz/FepE/Etk N-terminal domain-containing protein [Acidimicrobiia bacterium]MDH5293121.1 Wzz/FepE/Etk N-terminal domain-containing protein [Acidimicrobiia bacterium]